MILLWRCCYQPDVAATHVGLEDTLNFEIHSLNFPLVRVDGSILIVLGFATLEISKSHSASQSRSVGLPKSSTPMLA
jgi:hypothetical protein